MDGLAALVELDIRVSQFDLVLSVFLNKPGIRALEHRRIVRMKPLCCPDTSNTFDRC
ncbi:hypothetical protein [Pseudomonas sp. PDM25]|uniref:hypothetical protein n=1 Tax=Pseudomonas sp. PDM25 TaxID=2854772 RepID=UPI002810D3CB|nr:hypothetical protein [Pseudomonas sp. PDM25]